MLFENEKDQFAAVVMEPMVVDFPKDNFLEKVKKLAHDNNAVLIFDEVVTGFRFAKGGAQELLKVEPDIATFGKGMANGMPLGAIVGKSEYMKIFDDVFYSTTYAGEAVSLAAGLATVQEIVDKNVPRHMQKMGQIMQKGFNAAAKETGAPCAFLGLPIRGKVTAYDENGQESLVWKSLFFQEAVKRGVFFGQGAVFQSYSHKDEDIEQVIEKCTSAMKVVNRAKNTKDAEKMLEGDVVKPVLKFPV
jgi:glutamate-1-semialdehyde aminotransferase